jgi:exodeoxyribonuclease V alpha subunit
MIERIVFKNEATLFAVARLRLNRGPARQGRLVTVTGSMPGLAVGEAVSLDGTWVDDRTHGATFQVTAYHPHAPEDPEGIRRYLGSGLLPGVGPATAERIVAVFAGKTLEILEQSPDLLIRVKGISARRAAEIGAIWAAQRETRALALFLQQHEVSPALAPRLQAQYGAAAETVIRRDPYQLARDIRGIGFQTADDIARKLGLPEHSPQRTAAAAAFVLSRATDNGHCYLPKIQLVAQTADLIKLPEEPVLDAITAAQREGHLVIEGDSKGDRVYLPSIHTPETGFARRLYLLQRTSRPIAAGEADHAILQTAAAATGVLLSEGQREALALALREPVSIITGGPGSGKTTALRALIAVLERRQVRYCLAAPTGRAARRLGEATDRPASTLHRLLDFAPGSEEFLHNPDRPLPYQFVIVDEASMVDIVLAYHLGQALPPDAQLLLVGDVDQLPSVGPGNVLRDLIGSGSIPFAKLTTLFRQARDSKIIQHALEIRDGALQHRPPDSDDFFFVDERRPEPAIDKIVRLVGERIPRRFGLDPIQDVQVLCPVNRGAAGVGALNAALQAALNGRRLAHSLSWGGQQFAAGDKVMQTRNNYDLNVFNGDVGQIVAIDTDTQTLHVDYGNAASSSIVAYGLRDLDELQLAYAASVHKSQGSEYPCIVLLLLPQHGLMLRRDVLYTAVTRAKRLCVIVGSGDALLRAVRTSDPEARNTRLTERLRERPGAQ